MSDVRLQVKYTAVNFFLKYDCIHFHTFELHNAVFEHQHGRLKNTSDQCLVNMNLKSSQHFSV